VEAIPLAVDTDRFAPGNRDVAKAKFGVAGKRAICTVSRIYHYKAHDAVFQAIANLSSEERKDLVYLIAGEGPYEPELREKATGLGVDSHVRWVGFVAEDELPQLYRASDLFVLCTRDAPEERSVEGFGLVFLEAQSCGTPVVGTRIGGIPSAIHDGEGGWLIEQDDSEKLTAIIRQLLRSPECFVTAGKESRQRVLRESTWKSYGCQFSSALRSVGIHYAESKTGGAPTMTETRQGVSVVVPTLNRGSYLHDTLSDLVAQDYRPLEILVVDQSDEVDPELMALVRNRSELISYHKVQFRGLPSARNYGAQHAKYEALVFVDDDIRCGPWLVSEHLRALAKPNVGMGAGGIDERTSARASNSIPGQFNSWTATPVRSFGAMGECLVHHVAGCNFSVWRSVLDGAGGFDEALSMGAALYEETELCLRVRERGFAIGFNGSARVQHLVAGNGGCRVADLPKYMEALAHNRAIVIGRHLRWFQAPTAYIRLLLLFISYAAHYHELGIFWPGLGGLLRGLRDAKNAPVCSHHEIEVHA
jgi:GT2 family glycosyltransferase